MPIYEYACSACEHEFEQIQKFSDPSVCDCPKCHKKNSVHRKLSTSAFHLSGSGWYSDGYGKGGGSKSQGKAESTGGGESKPSESKPSESKTVSACAHGACGCAA